MTTTLQDIINLAIACGIHQERMGANRWEAKCTSDEAQRARYESYVKEDEKHHNECEGYLAIAVARFAKETRQCAK